MRLQTRSCGNTQTTIRVRKANMTNGHTAEILRALSMEGAEWAAEGDALAVWEHLREGIRQSA